MSDCVFCKIIADKNSNYFMESDLNIAIADIKPVTPGHTLVIPKKHFADFESTEDEYLKDAIVFVKKVTKRLKSEFSLAKGFNFVINQGKVANQVIFHLHIHIIPRY